MTFQTRDEAFDAMEAARHEWLAAARAWAEQYARHGQVITINDVIRYGPALPEHCDPRVRGAVFRDPTIWDRVGYAGSTRKLSHRRPVMQFRLVGA